jgi:hypothetical protein
MQDFFLGCVVFGDAGLLVLPLVGLVLLLQGMNHCSGIFYFL